MIFHSLVQPAVHMFQTVSVVLLGIESLIFYFPSQSAGFCRSPHVLFRYRQIGEEQKTLFFHLPVFLFFSIFQQVYQMALMIYPVHIVGPDAPIFRFLFPQVPFPVSQRPKFLCNIRNTPFFKAQNVMVTISAALLKKCFTGIKTVCAQAYWQAREFLMQLFQQPPAGFPLTVLFFSLKAFVFYKLCHDAHKDIFPEHEFCFQYIVVVFPVFLRGAFSMGTVQTLRVQLP